MSHCSWPYIYIYTPLFVCWAVCCGCVVATFCDEHCVCILQFHLFSVQRSAVAMCVPRCACVPLAFPVTWLSRCCHLSFGWFLVMSCSICMLTNPLVFVSWETFELWVPRYFGFKEKLFFPPTLCPHTFSFFTLPSLHSSLA